MLTFRNTNIFFSILVVAIMLMNVWIIIPGWLYVVVVLSYLAILAYGSYNIQSNFFLPVICDFNVNKKVISLSFDDGPVTKYTPEILQVLRETNVSAAFFCIGRHAKENTALLREMHAQGHLVGNHSYCHAVLFDFLPWKKMLSDLESVDHVMKDTIGVRPRVFRPPYGVTTPAMKKALKAGDYTAVGWNVRSFDTVSKNENQLFEKLTNSLRPGAIILLHDTQRITASVLPRFIAAARNEGYEFVRLDKMLNLQWYA